MNPILRAKFNPGPGDFPVHIGGGPIPLSPQLVGIAALFNVSVNASNTAAVTFTVTHNENLSLLQLSENDTILSVYADYDDEGTRKWAPFPLTTNNGAHPFRWTQPGTSDPVNLTDYGVNGQITLAMMCKQGFVWRPQPATMIGGPDTEIAFEIRLNDENGQLVVNQNQFSGMSNLWDRPVFWYGNSGTGPLGGIMDVGRLVGDDEDGTWANSLGYLLYVRQKFRNQYGETDWLAGPTLNPNVDCVPPTLTVPSS
jgi:hypothetical protein